jgi:hypothetical protein
MHHTASTNQYSRAKSHGSRLADLSIGPQGPSYCPILVFHSSISFFRLLSRRTRIYYRCQDCQGLPSTFTILITSKGCIHELAQSLKRIHPRLALPFNSSLQYNNHAINEIRLDSALGMSGSGFWPCTRVGCQRLDFPAWQKSPKQSKRKTRLLGD